MRWFRRKTQGYGKNSMRIRRHWARRWFRGSPYRSVPVSAVFVIIVGLITLLCLSFQQANGMSASAVIGQTDLTSGFVNGIPANNHGLNGPAASQIDTTGHRMFVADTNNNRVLVYNLDNSNNLTGQTASYVLGQPNFEASAGSTNRNTLNNPTGLAYDDANHRLFVSEAQNDRIVVYDLSGGITNGMNASHVIGQPTFYGYSNNSDRSHLFFPQGIFYDPSHSRLFAADTLHNRVLVFDLSGGITDGMNASNVLGQPDFTSDSSQTTQSGMSGPHSIGYDTNSQRLFVPDLNNHRVLVFDLSGGITDGMNASNVLGQPDFTSNAYGYTTQNGLGNVVGVAYDTSSSRLFVADGSNCRVLVFNLSGGITNGMNASQVIGQPDFSQGYMRTTQNGLSSYARVDLVADGRLLVSDQGNNRIVTYDTTSIADGMNASSVLGQADYTTSFSNGVPSPTDTGLHDPRSVSVDTVHHRLFAADTLNNRVLVFNLDASNNPVDTTADYVIGQPDFTTNSCGYSQNSNCYPDKVDYDSSHNRLFVVNADYSVLVYDLSGGITNGMNASNVIGQSDFSNPVSYCGYNNIQSTQAGVCSIAGLAYDAGHDRLFVTDSYNHRILAYDLAGGITNGMDATSVLGQPDFTSDQPSCLYQGSVTQSGLCYPQGLAYDSNHDRLFVSDSTNARVVTFDLAGGITNGMSASHVIGQTNFTTVNYGRTRNFMESPISLAFNPRNDQLFVADANNYRILVFDLAGGITDGMDASDVIGQPDYTSSAVHCYYSFTNPPTADGFCSPYSMALAPSDNRFYVADTSNNRIMLFNLAFQFTTKSLPNTTVGATYTQKLSALYGSGSTTYAITSGALPNGITLDSATGMLSGTPGTPGSYSFTVQATDGQGATVSQALTIQVFTPVQITTSSLADGQTAASYDQAIATVNGQAPLSFSITSGDLPAGLSINDSTGHITGMPSSTGDFNFTVSVSDANGTTDSKALSMHVTAGPLTIISSTLPNGIDGGTYNQTINAAGGQSPYSFSITSGRLPVGLSLDSTTGAISGTPTEQGSFPFTVRVMDAASTSVSKGLTLTINEHVTGGYNAADVLGHTDGSGNPIWNQKSEYNGAGAPSRGGLSYPQGSVVDTVHHRLFVSECGGVAPRIDEYDLNAQNTLVDHTPDHVIGQPNFTSSNNLYNASSFNCATGLSYDAVHNRLFAPDDIWRKSRVLVFDLSSGITDGMAASYVLGQPDFTTGVNYSGRMGDSVTRSGLSDTYGGTIYDTSTNYLYVSDSGNARVLVYDLSNGIANGMDAAYVIGQPDFTSSANALTQDGLGYAYGLALDTVHHRLFVADWGNGGRVMVYDTSSLHNGMNASYVLGEADFTSNNSASDSGNTPDAKSFGPTGLAYDSVHQRLFVEDDNSNRVLVFDVSTITNNEDAIGVIGQPNTTSANCNQGTTHWDSTVPSSQASMCDTEGLSDYYDTGNNRLYISDSSNNRVLMYDFAKLQDIPSNLNEGAAYTQTLGSQTQGTTAYAVVTGSLPQGMTLNASTGVLSGTPTKPGTYSFTVRLTDDNGASGTYSDDHSYSLVVAASQHVPAPTSTPTSKKATPVSEPDKTAGNDSVQSETKAIDLDSQPAYTSGSGYTVTVPTGQIITFTAVNTNGAAGEHHTMVVNKIDVSNPADPTVMITVHSLVQSFTLHLNKQQPIDLDQDGTNDQLVIATAITKDTATLKIISLLKSPAKTVASSQAAKTSKQTKVPNYAWLYVAGGLILLAIGVLYYRRHSRKSLS